MKQEVPGYLTRVLRRHPLLAADLLSLRNRWLRVRTDVRVLASSVLLIIASVTLLAVVASGAREWLAGGFGWLGSHELWVGVIVALYSGLHVAQLRPSIESRHTRSWLVAASPRPGMPRVALLWRTLWVLVLQVLSLESLVLLLGAPHLSGAALAVLAGWIASGALLGGLVGWWRGAKQPGVSVRHENSRYVPAARRNPQHQPSSDALSRLPLVRGRAWLRPENTRIVLLVLIASMPAGTSALSGGCAMLVGLLLSYGGALAHVVVQTGSEAARWLRATPISFVAFAWPIVRRAVLHQVVLSLLAASLLLPLGAAPLSVVYFVVLWLALVLMAWLLWLVGCFHGERPVLKVVSSVLASLAVEQFVRGWGIVCALLWTCWNLRRRTA